MPTRPKTESPSPQKDSLSPRWDDTYAELRNKIRWAIGSTTAETGDINLNFRSQTALAGCLAADCLKVLKLLHEAPNLQVNPETARRLLES